MVEEAAQQREAMHLRSKEAVKLWSNTIAGQRQKKIEAKRIREELEEEQRKETDREEARYQEQIRREAIGQAKAQQYYQTDRVKGFHRALLLTEVFKEREAQVELKRRIQNASKELDQEFLKGVKAREDEALKQEQQKALQKKLDTQAVVEEQKIQMRNIEVARSREKLENVKEGEEIQRLCDLHLWEQSVEKQRQVQQKRNIMQAHQEHISNRDVVRGIEEQKQALEDQQRKLFLSAKKKMAQMLRERIVNKLTATQQEKVVNEEETIAKAIGQQEARQAQIRRAEEEKKAAMLKAISEHRETMLLEQEQKELIARQSALDVLQAKQEADRIFLEKQQEKAQKAKEDGRSLQDHYTYQMAEKHLRHQQQKIEQQESQEKNTELIAAEENQFQQYASQVIRAAAEAQRNTLPLSRAAREGLGGGSGPSSAGYLVQDHSGVEMPRYVCSTTQNVKELNEMTDISRAKKRLGFTW
ncbi:hypothetical protein CRUP_011592 [Coryphaenoides rupestris]|nr:hypothetical protein CRUP_011592 [Coryphaenoides rupestris]